MRPPLSMLDLVPVPEGSSASAALACSMYLVRLAGEAGYRRWWVAEHHLNEGVAGTSPGLVLAMAAGAAPRGLRLGAAAWQMGHRSALSVVEEAGLLDAVLPGRIDLGLGRSGGVPPVRPAAAAPPGDHRTPEGLLVPAPVSLAHLAGHPRLALTKALLTPSGTPPQPYGEQVDDVLALLDGTRAGDDVVPGRGADVEVWVHGSSGGESATVAGERGLRFSASYHITPARVLEAVGAYRAAFRPSLRLDRPYVAVSADVVVAPTDAAARALAAGYGLWVLGIRDGSGARPYPSAARAGAHRWTDRERALVADRVATQFVGAPASVVSGLDALVAATGADEVVVTTITHDPADRLRSYSLLAEAWAARP